MNYLVAIDSRPLPNDTNFNFSFFLEFIAMLINILVGSLPGDKIKIRAFLLFKSS